MDKKINNSITFLKIIMYIIFAILVITLNFTGAFELYIAYIIISFLAYIFKNDFGEKSNFSFIFDKSINYLFIYTVFFEMIYIHIINAWVVIIFLSVYFFIGGLKIVLSSKKIEYKQLNQEKLLNVLYHVSAILLLLYALNFYIYTLIIFSAFLAIYISYQYISKNLKYLDM